MFSSEQIEVLAQLLERAETECEPYEFHGVITALVSLYEDDVDALWLEFFKVEYDPNDLVVKETIDQINQQIDLINQGLSEDALSFMPLMPDDEEPFQERVYALASWCQGYIMGLNFKGSQWIDGQSQELKEMIKDLEEISQIENYNFDQTEEDERSLFEIIEYVKTGVIFIHDTLTTIKQESQQKHTIH